MIWHISVGLPYGYMFDDLSCISYVDIEILCWGINRRSFTIVITITRKQNITSFIIDPFKWVIDTF
nr:MAG TPA: hypothetical protein [Caudoviricetes sp.]